MGEGNGEPLVKRPSPREKGGQEVTRAKEEEWDRVVVTHDTSRVAQNPVNFLRVPVIRRL